MAAARRPKTKAGAIRGPYARSGQTRERVIEATIQAIQTDGFHSLSTNEIARRVNASWGTLQYHFKNKDGLLAAALEHSSKKLAERIDRETIQTGSLEKRVEWLVDVAWKQFRSREYQVMFEVLTNVGSSRSEYPQVASVRRKSVVALDKAWDRVFSDVSAGKARVHGIRHLLFATLRGLAVQKLSGSSSSFSVERDLLIEAVVGLLKSRRPPA